MIDIKILLITAGNLEFKIITDSEYDTIVLKMKTENTTIEMDSYDLINDKSKNNILIKKDDDIYEVEVNMIEFDFIFYKDFYFELLKDGKVVETSSAFKLEPKGRKDLYGIVNKLMFDFERLWSISGTECALFVKNLESQPCPECYDDDLGQRISTNCSMCNGTGQINHYIPIYFKARRIKTQSQQVITDKGITFYNLAIYTTFSRLDFVLGSIMFDLTTREFFEIKNANEASIGGVRTSTQITAQIIPSNDARIKPLFPLLK